MKSSIKQFFTNVSISKIAVISATFCIIAVSFLNFFEDINDSLRLEKDNLARSALFALNEVKTNSSESLENKLQKLQDSNVIGFYLIKSERSPASIASVSGLDVSSFELIPDNLFRNWVENGKNKAVYITSQLDGRLVTIGMFNDPSFVESMTKINKGSLLRLIFLSSAVLGLLMLYLFRPFERISHAIQWKGSDGFLNDQKMDGHTFREATVISDYLHISKKQIDKAKLEIEELRRQIMPSFLSEMNDKEPFPRVFDAFLATCDLNNSTMALSNENLKEVPRRYFDKFYFEAMELTNRYRAYFHEVIGDAFIFYTKVSDGMSKSEAQTRAVNLLGSISELAYEIDKEVFDKLNYHFRIKGALDYGRIEVYKGLTGIKILGVAPRHIYMTTARMIKFIKDALKKKTMNQFVIPDFIFEESIAYIQDSVDANEKIQEEALTDTYSYKIIESFKPATFENRPKFLLQRHDSALVKTFIFLRTSNDEQLVMDWLNTMSDLQILYTKDTVIAEIESTFKWLSKKKDMGAAFARFINMLPNIVPKYQIPNDLVSELEQCILSADARIQPNAIHCLDQFEKSNSLIKSKLEELKTNRSIANALIAILKVELDQQNIDALMQMLKSNNASTRASGCYAVGRIFEHYRENNLILFSTNPELKCFYSVVKDLKDDVDVSVKNQSKFAIQEFEKHN